MGRAQLPTGIEIEFETFGSPDDPALLLIMGLSAQMTAWPDSLCQALATDQYVVRFDNRDCGLSTKFDGVEVDVMAVITVALAEQEPPEVPYTLSDMAADAVGLLDHLGIERAHIVGASMGGMIAQTVAIEHPARTLSLTSIMSQPGDPDVGQPSPEAMAVLFSPAAADRDAYIDSSIGWGVWSSQKYFDAAEARRQAALDYDRSFCPDGAPRQMAAIYASGRRSDGLKTLKTPTLVIHGRDDKLIAPSGGVRTAELIEGANLLLMADMGHDFPEPLIPTIVDAIRSHTRS